MRIAALFLAAGLLGGCSVGMALSGSDTPDLGALRIGATRGEVELHLGPPVATTSLDNGFRADRYEYEVGNDPSAGRAIGHGIMDVLTLGAWEIIGTPIEGFKGTSRTVVITYDTADRVAKVQGTGPKDTL